MKHTQRLSDMTRELERQKASKCKRERQKRNRGGKKRERRQNNPTVLVFYPFPHPAQNLIVQFLICHKPIHKKLYRALSFQLSTV